MVNYNLNVVQLPFLAILYHKVNTFLKKALFPKTSICMPLLNTIFLSLERLESKVQLFPGPSHTDTQSDSLSPASV